MIYAICQCHKNSNDDDMGERSMTDLANKDASLFLDMLLSARDARAFVADMDEPAFRASRLLA